jgi:chromate transporter
VGATLVGIAFVVPSFLMVVALGWAYMHWRFAVDAVGVLWRGCCRHWHHRHEYPETDSKKRGQRQAAVIFLLLAAVTVITESEVAWLFIAAGVLVWFLRAPPKFPGKNTVNSVGASMPLMAGLFGNLDVTLLTQIGIFFTKQVLSCLAQVWRLCRFCMAAW